MKVAIMQPYIFPYIGYFQLINVVDIFIFYDDVNYINKGWINRNKIFNNSSELLFTIPLKKASQNSLIKDVLVNQELLKNWLHSFFKTIEFNYKKAPYYNQVVALIQNVFSNNNNVSISQLAIQSVTEICNYLQIKKQFIVSSQLDNDFFGDEKEDRLINISLSLKATHYINLIGGLQLYSKNYFKTKNLNLQFIKPNNINYQQYQNPFVAWLSIIDVLMFNDIETTKNLLTQFELV